MIIISNLIFFILGIVFWQIITPIIDSLVSLALTGIEAYKAKISIGIATSQLEIQKMTEEEPSPRILGFAPPPEELETPIEEEDIDEDL